MLYIIAHVTDAVNNFIDTKSNNSDGAHINKSVSPCMNLMYLTIL